jgi:hypothetical protein
MTFVEGFPYYLLSSLYALFLVPLGPDLIGLSTLLGTLASVAVLAMLLRLWSGPWSTQSTDFDVRFAATLIVTSLVSQYFPLHDLTITILAAVLLANHWMGQPTSEGWGTIRLALAALWVTCFVGPVATRHIMIQLVPPATLFVGWSIWATARSAGRRLPSSSVETAA